MKHTIEIHFNGTPEQFEALHNNCAISEAMMARTLLCALSQNPPEKQIDFVLDWFRSVRFMAQANLISSGIKFSSDAAGTPPAFDRVLLLDEIAAVIKTATDVMPVAAVMTRIGVLVTEAFNGTLKPSPKEGHAE